MSTPAQIKAAAKLQLTQQLATDLASMKNQHEADTKAILDTETNAIANARTTETQAKNTGLTTKTASLDLLATQRKQIETTYTSTITAAKDTSNAAIATAKASHSNAKITLDKTYTDAVLQKKLDEQTAIAALP